MSNASMTPGSRPRRGVIGVLALLGAGALTTALVLAAGETRDPARVAAAVELDTFASCEDLAAWGSSGGGASGTGAGGDAPVADGPLTTTAPVMADSEATTAAAPEELQAQDEGSASSGSASSGEAYSGDGRATREQAGAGDDAAEADGGADADGTAERAADETNVAVEGVDEIDLVDRLTEDVVLVASASRLAVVDLAEAEVVEATNVPWDAQITYDAEAGVAWVVGHGDTGGGVSVERYAVDTDGLEVEGRWTTPGTLVDARRVGDELHVVATDGFATAWGAAEDGSMVDGFRGTVVEPVPPGPAPDDASVPFEGGPVPCDEVLHPEGPSDPSATLLVTLPAAGAVEPERAAEVVGSGSLVHVTTESIYLATPQWGGATPTTGIHRFDLATLEPTGSGSVEGSLLDEFSMSEHDGVLRVAVTDGFGGGRGVPVPVEPQVQGTVVDDGGPTADPGTGRAIPDGLNEIVVLDTDGALDEVGRTERFGHPGETLHGIRFAGTTAYAVTFLQTDPFYVVDLADPAAPEVVGEVELPGFSSYLHPLGDGLVVGFGPGEDGRIAAKLFDVSDPAAPVVADDMVLGDDSAVAYDHHAYLDLGDGRFAVPATSWDMTSVNAVVVVDTAGGELDEVERLEAEIRSGEMVTRVLTVGDGWALLAGPEIVTLDADGGTTATIRL